jgi:hypothetical protein
MPTERIQRRIDRLLDEADQATAQSDWVTLHELAKHVLTLEPGNADAEEFIAVAERGLGTHPTKSNEELTTGGGEPVVPAATRERSAAVELCHIEERQRSIMLHQFEAIAVGPLGSRIVGLSDSWGMGEDDSHDQSEAALKDLVDRLLGRNWSPLPKGSYWYQYRFQRPVPVTPLCPSCKSSGHVVPVSGIGKAIEAPQDSPGSLVAALSLYDPPPSVDPFTLYFFSFVIGICALLFGWFLQWSKQSAGPIVLVIGVLAIILALGSLIEMKVSESKRPGYRARRLGIEIWASSWYCRADKGIFLPNEKTSVPPAQFREWLWGRAKERA